VKLTDNRRQVIAKAPIAFGKVSLKGVIAILSFGIYACNELSRSS
jgi:hypothetical protein